MCGSGTLIHGDNLAEGLEALKGGAGQGHDIIGLRACLFVV